VRFVTVIPAYQAAAALGGLLERLLRQVSPAEVIVVDDGSRDGTGDVARALGVCVVAHDGNRGKGAALRTGFDHARGADAVITLDADGQHPPECLPAFLAAAEHADLVMGRRARSGRMPWARRFANGFSSGWATWLAGQHVSDSQCGYRLYRRALIDSVPTGHGRYEFETQILVRAARLGFRLAEVEIPTVYAEERSHLSPSRDVPRIVGTLARLTLEAAMPPNQMREARAALRARPGSAGRPAPGARAASD
jgi:glycosyltransferase involved in cell wall biosynthesis